MLKQEENNGTESNFYSVLVWSPNGEFLSSLFHLLSRTYPIFKRIFSCVDSDPYSQYGSNLDPDPQHYFYFLKI